VSKADVAVVGETALGTPATVSDEALDVISATGFMAVVPTWVLERTKHVKYALAIYCLLQDGPSVPVLDKSGMQVGRRDLPADAEWIAERLGVAIGAVRGTLQQMATLGVVSEHAGLYYPHFDDPSVTERLRATEAVA
jgi:hypothetical protein